MILQFVLFCIAAALSDAYLILKPPLLLPGRQTLLVFCPGFLVAPKDYVPLLQLAQSNLDSNGNLPLWVAIPSFPANLWVTDDQFDKGVVAVVRSAFDAISRAVHVAPNDVHVFFAGHSRGAISVQDLLFKANNYLISNPNATFGATSDSLVSQDDVSDSDTAKQGHLEIFRNLNNRGLILFSAALQRKYRADHNGSYISDSYPILTLGCELDGLFRIFRVAESFYHSQLLNANVEGCEFIRPTIVIRGGNHMSCTSNSTKPSAFVAASDLPAEITRDAAHVVMAKAMACFISIHWKPSLARFSVCPELIEPVEQSELFLSPIVDSLLLEGSYNIMPACTDIPFGDTRPCWRGSPWAETANRYMTGLDSKIKVTPHDAYWKVYLVPVHLPGIVGSCDAPSENCLLSFTSVSQAVYPLLNGLDSGFSTIAADELRGKFMSRQASHYAAGIKDASFKDLDDNNEVCRDINAHALSYALEHADAQSLERYYRKGAQLKMGDDMGPFNTGPNWIWLPLKFEKSSEVAENGKPVVLVRSPTMRTPLDFKIKFSAGFHYCKLLSPAKALEWIYTDSFK